MNKKEKLCYCSGCRKRKEEKLNNVKESLNKLIEKVKFLETDLEIESWEIETKKGEEIPESWQNNISEKKDQVDRKEKEVSQIRDEWKEVKRLGIADEWWEETGKGVSKYLEETDGWLIKLY